jgi:hypothetical protein
MHCYECATPCSQIACFGPGLRLNVNGVSSNASQVTLDTLAQLKLYDAKIIALKTQYCNVQRQKILDAEKL